MIELVTKEEAMKIIDTKEHKGSFLRITTDKTIVAIDNTDGEAWAEEFNDIEKAIRYLNGSNEIFEED